VTNPPKSNQPLTAVTRRFIDTCCEWLIGGCFFRKEGVQVLRAVKNAQNLMHSHAGRQKIRNRSDRVTSKYPHVSLNPNVTFVNAVIVTKADPVRPQHALADADSGHGRWVDNMCESAFAAAHRAKGFTIAASRNVTLGLMTHSPRYGDSRLVQPRLGQATFRIAVLDAYGRACAVTGEHSLPALEASHIRSYAQDGPHEIRNGLLLRADLHRLFDTGYVTVTPDLRLDVSGHLRKDYNNGRSYYPLQGA
jgi:HNH endonuclease